MRIFLAYLMIGMFVLILPLSGYASKPIKREMSTFIKQAHVIAIAKITHYSQERTTCSATDSYTLVPQKAVTGHLQNSKPIEYHHGTYFFGENCPSVVYMDDPATSETQVGKNIIVTLKWDKSTKSYQVTSSYNLSELEKIKAQAQQDNKSITCYE